MVELHWKIDVAGLKKGSQASLHHFFHSRRKENWSCRDIVTSALGLLVGVFAMQGTRLVQWLCLLSFHAADMARAKAHLSVAEGEQPVLASDLKKICFLCLFMLCLVLLMGILLIWKEEPEPTLICCLSRICEPPLLRTGPLVPFHDSRGFCLGSCVDSG